MIDFDDGTWDPDLAVSVTPRTCNEARIETLEQENAALRMAQRFGTPFDPTGAKTGTEIHSLRRRVTALGAGLQQAVEAMELAERHEEAPEIRAALNAALTQIRALLASPEGKG